MLAITALFFFAGCEWFDPAEVHKTESGRTTYRAANESPTEHPALQKSRASRDSDSVVNRTRFCHSGSETSRNVTKMIRDKVEARPWNQPGASVCDAGNGRFDRNHEQI